MCDKRKIRYPSFKLLCYQSAYFETISEVERYIHHDAYIHGAANKAFSIDSNYISNYVYVVIELPIGIEVRDYICGQNLSVRVYLPDGTLWGIKPYADFFPKYGLNSDGYNYWGKRNQFWGREPEEIKFKPGDIVEIFGYPGNGWWSEDEVNLAIIVKTPPTKAEVAEMFNTYKATHAGFDLCDHALSKTFGSHLDSYEVVSFAYDGIDHASTISVFEPTKQVSPKRKDALMKLYEKYKTKK